jgi:hypothetical protein
VSRARIRLAAPIVAAVVGVPVMPGSASAASLTLPAPALGDMSVAAASVHASRTPSITVTRAGAADLVIAAVAGRRGRYTVVTAAFDRPPGATTSRSSTVVSVSGPGVSLQGVLTGGSVLSAAPPSCTDAQYERFSQAYRGTFRTLRGRLQGLPPEIRPALLAKFAANELCGSSYEQLDLLRHFAWNVASGAPLPVSSGVTQTWSPGASSGTVCVHVATRPPQPGAEVRATLASLRGSSFSGSGTLGPDGSAVVMMTAGSGDYQLEVALNGTPVSAGFGLTLPGPLYGRTASSCP